MTLAVPLADAKGTQLATPIPGPANTEGAKETETGRWAGTATGTPGSASARRVWSGVLVEEKEEEEEEEQKELDSVRKEVAEETATT